MTDKNPRLGVLTAAIGKACQPTHIRLILFGRADVLVLPREWVMANFETAATSVIDLSDDWEYRRLLELAESLDAELVRRIAALGTVSSNQEVREAAQEYLDPGII